MTEELQTELDNARANLEPVQAELDNVQTAHDTVQTELDNVRAKLESVQAELDSVQTELNSEVGGMMKADLESKHLGTDFTYHIHDEQVEDGILRSIKIQCPGVRHNEISIEIVFNGCVVTINRQASRGVVAAEWVQKFQFRPSQGLFEFKE